MKKKKILVLTAILALCLTVTGSVSAQDPELQVIEVTGSSVLPTSAYGDYKPSNMLDNNPTTAWVENQEGDGYDSTFTFRLPDNAVVTGIQAMTGYCKSESLFYKNSAPLSVSYEEGDEIHVIDLSAAAEDYYVSSKGCYYELEKPYVSHGVMTFKIGNIRAGSTYKDTCISEFHLLGFLDDGSGAASVTASGSASGDVILTEELTGRLQSECSWIYKKHCNFQLIDSAILLNDLTSEDKAMVTYWYEYHYEGKDERIASQQEYNVLSTAAAKEIIAEHFGSVSDEDINTFISRYAQRVDGDMITTYGSGDFGDAGLFYFDAGQMHEDGEYLVLEGYVVSYDSSRQEYVPAKPYRAHFSRESNGTHNIYQFVSLIVGDSHLE